jgi:hypothetical protein
LFWANIFGLPGWVRAEIQKELERHSIHLEFAKLHLRGFRQIIARDVRLRTDASTNSPNLTVREAEFLVDFQQLKKRNFSLSGVRLVSGTLLLPCGTHEDRILSVTNITADVLLLPDDTIQIVNFAAETLGARATLSGELRQYSKFQFQGGTNGTSSDWRRPLAQVLEIAEELRFVKPA